ncbi:fumarylacetoacetate hydrolase family protein [Paenibacillus sp. IB182496]|uniref:Fumarylacetoacetate hydrolase family protein n=1 Tax=Paenibacillus sabuli TaxID=2772509 RepID=A0A927GSZ5_9BACL|nr:fumarylacetoacetate hydrolase family protein [Paenibacillus sabuli]MBD2846555.1 fumarylacetoacetate hydrolase family protein [Paenibacillus sabuli]
MRLVRYIEAEGKPPVFAACTEEGQVVPLPQDGIQALIRQARSERVTPLEWVRKWMRTAPRLEASEEQLRLAVPLVAPEVWAAGVTYARSRDARNYEATGGKLDATTFYDKVYDAPRPELFLKSTAARTVGPEEEMLLRSDSNWQIPEPELGLVLDGDGAIVGYTAGNDLSCRDIEGENPLYLPQAKVWKRSCSLGPAIVLAESVEDPYRFELACRIYRGGALVSEGTASTGQLKRRFDELVAYLIRDNDTFDGNVLLTGTCIVPPNAFTLQNGDVVEIEIGGIGTLRNTMRSPTQNATQNATHDSERSASEFG